jgi:hypothetical protein
MDAIYIPQLARALEQTETLQVRDYLPGLDTLTPVQGVMKVRHWQLPGGVGAGGSHHDADLRSLLTTIQLSRGG